MNWHHMGMSYAEMPLGALSQTRIPTFSSVVVKADYSRLTYKSGAIPGNEVYFDDPRRGTRSCTWYTSTPVMKMPHFVPLSWVCFVSGCVWIEQVIKMDDCIGTPVEERIASMASGDVMLLENVRFHAGEEVRKKGK